MALVSPAPQASSSPATPGRDTRLPRAGLIDFTAWPAQLDTRLAGLLLTIPDLVALDLPGLVRKAGYPGTAAIPPASRILSLLALKLTATRRVSHVDDLLTDPASALFAGLSILPKKSALTDYSYRLSHDHQRNFLAALDTQMISPAWPPARKRSSTWTSTPSWCGHHTAPLLIVLVRTGRSGRAAARYAGLSRVRCGCGRRAARRA